MTENLEAFAKRVGSLEEKVGEYGGLYQLFGSILQDNMRVRGRVDFSRIEMRSNPVKGLIVDISKFGDSGFNVRIHISLGKDNLQEVYGRFLPGPEKITVGVLESISEDEILQMLYSELQVSEDVRKGFQPENSPTR